MKADKNQPQNTDFSGEEPGGLQFVFTAFAGFLKGHLEHLERAKDTI